MKDTNAAPLAAAVYWVGHSLIESKVKTETGRVDLMTLVGTFARARGLDYSHGDHTLWGASLSALWRGRPHGYDRDATEILPKREEFERTSSSFDTLVLTEALPLRSSLSHEFSPFYARQFLCAFEAGGHQGRVYLYQTWTNFQGNDRFAGFPTLDQFDWRFEMKQQRKLWEQLADAATQPTVPTPSWLNKLGLTRNTHGPCQPRSKVHIIPVGDVLLAIDARIAQEQPDQPTLTFKDGTPISMSDFFANPYINWPTDWPQNPGSNAQDTAATLATLKKRNPAKPLDDIHPSHLGIHVAALVHFATIYQQSPVGLPAPDFLDDDVAESIACLVWQTVLADNRTGVTGSARCQT